MESHLVPGDPILVENIVSYLKAMGIFDEFRHECLADVDTKSSCQNLSQRVDGYTSKFLATETWNPDLNKNEVRNRLRKHIDESGMLAVGADHVVEQVINPKIQQLFLPKIIEVVHQYLNKETEKLNKKQERASFKKFAAETLNETPTKAKATVLDPIADILSFTYSKPKQVTLTSNQNVQAKVSDISKVEKKKEESPHPTKIADVIPKIEKKKEDVVQQIKASDNLLKIKKEVIDHAAAPDAVPNSEKKEETIRPIKTELPVELPKECVMAATSQTNDLEDSKGIDQVLRQIKVEECDESSETSKKIEKGDIKNEKKKMDDLKLQVHEKLPQSEDTNENKSLLTTAKNNSSSKNKLESSKHKRNKPLGLGYVKASTKTGESHKSNVKESSDSSCDKLSGDQNKVSSKPSKVTTKDQPSSLKNNIPTKMVRCEKGGDSEVKSKSKNIPLKSSDKSVSMKVSSLKKEDSSAKMKYLPEKHEKTKKHNRDEKTPDSKSDSKMLSESSSSSDKGSRHSLQYSSSYESSQGSDPDRSLTSNVSSKEKPKHFSKHYRKESSSADSSEKPSADKKQSQSDSDSGTPKKDKSGKSSKDGTEEHKKAFVHKEAAKISSRSDSLGSMSSASDSQTSMKETSASTSGGETSDNSSRRSEKKKLTSKDKVVCAGVQNLPPPSPPPPTPGVSMNDTSAELSSVDETQSSQESESDASENSNEESLIISESDEEDSQGSSANLIRCLKTPEILNDIHDIFLFSSSSSEFEGFSSPEKISAPKNFQSDASSVHTSDLSSFDDELSEVECSSDLFEKDDSKKRFTIKEAEEILKAKAEKQRLEALKMASHTALDNKRIPRSSVQSSPTVVSLSENEVSLPPEPKRESRRERKLNPKYASNEYTSIFNSKRTSFITKQSNQNEVKPSAIADAKKIETDIVTTKDTQSMKRKTSATGSDKNYVSAVENSDFEASASSECGFVVLECSSEDVSCTKTNPNASDKNRNSLAETDSRSRIALKIKLSATKNDNATNKEPNSHGTKRKFEEEKFEEKEKGSKRACHRNSVNSSALESVANENKPFNNKTKHSSTVLSVEQVNDKEVFRKQKVNNGDVLNKIEHVRKNSHSKPNHINEKQAGD